MERQTERYIAHVHLGNCEIYVDATGSVISTVGEKTDRNTVFLYSIVVGYLNLPVFEWLSTDHHSYSISAQLNCSNAVNIINNGKQINR